MNSSLRKDYLAKWTPYPSYLDGIGARVVAITPENLLLRVAGEIRQIQLQAAIAVYSSYFEFWQSLSGEQLLQVFRVGDWVVYRDSKDHQALEFLLLMAPCSISQCESLNTRASQYQRFVEDVRSYFLQANLFPASTPSLVTCPGMEPPLVPMRLLEEEAMTNFPRFLPTSPELHLKKMLCRDYGDLFEIKRVYRNEIATEHHQPEFLMLEWYRVFANLKCIESDLKNLINYLIDCGWGQAEIADGTERAWKVVSMAELFKDVLNFELQPTTTHQQLKALAAELEVCFSSDNDSWDDTFFKIFLTKIEPLLKSHKFLILKDYPPSQAALARINAEGWADRMEFYIHGVEVGNAFNELNDPQLQEQRFLKDQAERRDLNYTDVPIDQQFLQGLRQGMPPSAGIAVGLERLFMGLQKIDKIEELLEFPHQPLYEK